MKSAQICSQNRAGIDICYTPAGTYKSSKQFLFANMVNGVYQQYYIDFEGDASYWDNGQGTTFQFTSKDSNFIAIGAQLNKGSIFKNFATLGLWRSPSAANDSLQFVIPEMFKRFNREYALKTLSYQKSIFTSKQTDAPDTVASHYNDQSGHHFNGNNYIGFAVDPYYDGYFRSGSTGITIENIIVGYFGTCLAFTPNGYTQNDDAHTISNIHFYDCKYCIRTGQPQEKGTSIDNIYSWGSCYNVLKHFGGGNYSFDGANIAGRCTEVFQLSIGHWFSSSINNWFCENIGYICNATLQMPVMVTNCNFDLSFFDNNLNRNVIISTSNFLTFHGCTFRYYDGLIHNIYYHGSITAPPPPDNYFGGGNLINQ